MAVVGYRFLEKRPDGVKSSRRVGGVVVGVVRRSSRSSGSSSRGVAGAVAVVTVVIVVVGFVSVVYKGPKSSTSCVGDGQPHA